MLQNRFEENERRRPRVAVLTFDEVLEAFEGAREEHILGSPSTEWELGRLEQTLGAPLPASFRVFLERLGGGLFFRGHEIFGPRRVMVHDIELVPDILSMRRTLAAQGSTLPERAIPFHRARGTIHFLRLGGGSGAANGAGEIVSLPASEASAPNLESFLETVVMPRVARGGPAIATGA